MVMRAFVVVAAALIGTGSAAFAVDHSARDTTPRSPVELCCVDITVLPPLETHGAGHAVIDPTQLRPVTDSKPDPERKPPTTAVMLSPLRVSLHTCAPSGPVLPGALPYSNGVR